MTQKESTPRIARIRSIVNTPHHREEMVGWAACLVITASLWSQAGSFGVVSGVAVTVAWRIFSPPVAIGVGHVLFLALVPAGITLSSLLIIEPGFLILLSAHAFTFRYPQRFLIASLSALLIFAALTALMLTTQPMWLTVMTLLGAVVFTSYALHRILLVRLGKVSKTHDE